MHQLDKLSTVGSVTGGEDTAGKYAELQELCDRFILGRSYGDIATETSLVNIDD